MRKNIKLSKIAKKRNKLYKKNFLQKRLQMFYTFWTNVPK